MHKSCHFPVVTGNSVRIRVNRVQFAYHLLEKRSVILDDVFVKSKFGDIVEILECTVSDDRPTGRTVLKYVESVVVHEDIFSANADVIGVLVDYATMEQQLKNS